MHNENTTMDYHVHTQFAYCSQNDMLPETTIAIARKKGCGITLVEHAGQLYVSNENYWNQNVINNPDLLYIEETNRMDDYINYISKFKNTDVNLGLELDINCNGKIILRDQHIKPFDLFLGAIHYIPNQFTDLDKGFMWSLAIYCDYNIDILAHPFRIYRKWELPRPKHLYKKVATALYNNNIAAEINFHTNEPDWEFFQICIENGVKIAFGSDSHTLAEVCSFERNFELINKIYKGNIDDIMYKHQ